MPVLGFGTAAQTPPSNQLELDQLVPIFIDAIEAGFRHFDTAAVYGTEQPLGRAIEEALRRGLIKSRDELFITTKLWCTCAHHDLVLPAIKESLSNLGIDYVDLYLIHWPVRMKPKKINFYYDIADVIPFEMGPTWEAMEECQSLGLTKSIGVCNFTCKKLTDLLALARIPPAVNQVTSHQLLNQISQAKGKNIAQIALRWLYEQRVGIIVKSFNKERMIQNLQIFDWELSEDDHINISELPQQRVHSGGFIDPNGPFKTAEEFWDGEI
ncbi:Non-functional NADPH-dependent codeinone reductase 2 [Acorus gramineus]|uniref:Non-functional NADPH-dependent codeinone reductase 2 n=1 Tax=Acorus gramineus TaxID=55184 RepID=A0AAV9BNR1_ACOGR|nr:Non-functional NADPH-dependent codeinone reductase 2 [Acorus gramineus]